MLQRKNSLFKFKNPEVLPFTCRLTGIGERAGEWIDLRKQSDAPQRRLESVREALLLRNPTRSAFEVGDRVLAALQVPVHVDERVARRLAPRKRPAPPGLHYRADVHRSSR